MATPSWPATCSWPTIPTTAAVCTRNDVFVQRPIFVEGRLIAWVALSAHLIDMGGMVMGSFAPAASECFQEALRIPPVRILRQGVEVEEVWDIFRTNVRLDVLVEMDLRGLVAGANVAHQKVVDLVGKRGVASLADGMRALQHLSEIELRKRIALLADGSYRATGWVEWDDELFEVPCTLTVSGDPFTSTCTGAAPQAPALLQLPALHRQEQFRDGGGVPLAPDLPYTEGLLSPITLACPEGSIVNYGSAGADQRRPHPRRLHGERGDGAMPSAGHLGVSAEWAMPAPVTGWGSNSAIALNTWSAIGLNGTLGHLDVDGRRLRRGRRGRRSGRSRHGRQPRGIPPAGPGSRHRDPRVLVPGPFERRSVRTAVPHGAGPARAGGGNDVSFPPHGTDRLVGQMLAMRAYLPLEGAAGGMPGARSELWIRHGDGQRERVSTAAAGVVVEAGRPLRSAAPVVGGIGDPIARGPLCWWPTTLPTVAYDRGGGRYLRRRARPDRNGPSRCDQEAPGVVAHAASSPRHTAGATLGGPGRRRPMTRLSPCTPGWCTAVGWRSPVHRANPWRPPLPIGRTDVRYSSPRRVPVPGSSPVATSTRRPGPIVWWRPSPWVHPTPSRCARITGLERRRGPRWLFKRASRGPCRRA